MPPRSLLYVPGSRPELFPKAIDGAADAVILDLEDGVGPAEKETARESVMRFLGSRTEQHDSFRIWVRISADSLSADLGAAFDRGPHRNSIPVAGVILAKCNPQTLAVLDAALADIEHARRLPHNSIRAIGLIEEASALVAIAELAKYSRLLTVGIGEVDLLADLRIRRSAETDSAINAIRLQVIIHCAAAGLAPPIAPTSTDFRNLAEFTRTTEVFSSLGFRSRTAIHPTQIPVINTVFSPSQSDIANARDVVDRFTRAGAGVTVDAHGRMIDEAVARSAREILSRAERTTT